jgi:hypothetical protein
MGFGRRRVKEGTMAWKWYSVKTVYLVSVVGRPHGLDELYDTAHALAEERIVLYRARSMDEAISKAQAEAREYESEHSNPYGQKVRYTFTFIARQK